MLVQLTEQGEHLAEQALDAVLATDAAFLEPLSARQRDVLATAPKQLLLRRQPG